MVKPVGECCIGGCASSGELHVLRYWPGGMSGARGALPSLALCGAHWPVTETKFADARHWRAVYSLGVLSFRPTGVGAGS